MLVIAATQNKHKIDEMRSIIKEFGMEIKSQREAGLPDIEVVEDGETFEENSMKKAVEILKLSGKASIADDSGLEVMSLNGAPGVYSARFASENATYEENNEKLLKLLEGKADRTARFVSVITLAFPDGPTIIARGECHGKIIEEAKGTNGFGYDPLFIPDGCDKTFAEMSNEAKNIISHRAKALIKLREELIKRDDN